MEVLVAQNAVDDHNATDNEIEIPSPLDPFRGQNDGVTGSADPNRTNMHEGASDQFRMDEYLTADFHISVAAVLETHPLQESHLSRRFNATERAPDDGSDPRPSF